jgi:uncharacterized protein with ParB-like and HNH nuclease domain
MKPSIRILGEILYSPSQYVIPVFQRNYRWEAGQWQKLWDSLSEIREPEKKGNHFMGFLVFVPETAQPGQHTRFHLVDGQQRLTTCSILLAAIRNFARRLNQTELADEIHNYYLVHPLKKGEQHYRLLPKERDHDSYLALVGGGGEPTGRIADALAYFEERLDGMFAEDPQGLRALFDAVCQRLEFMCATLEAENAYNIFKSLNSTGVPLGQSDLIRNFVFMHVPPGEQDEFDRVLWGPLEGRFARADGTLDEEEFSQFFRNFLMVGGRYVPPKDTFASFEARYEATGFSPRALAQELTHAAQDYSVISGKSTDMDENVTKALAGLNVLESSTTYPLLLALFARRRTDSIRSEQLARCIEMLRGFILRRFVCGESSRGYGQMFVRALAKDDGDPARALEAYLLDRGWPDDQQFVRAFVTFPLYERGYTKEILETIERSRGHKEPASLADAQVEHIMPQTLSAAWRTALGPSAEAVHKDWLHAPGNLTLSAYNQELWNHDFQIKRARYGQSNVVITRELAAWSDWGEEAIRERGRKLANEAASIWFGPKESVASAPEGDDQDEETPVRRELRRRFWTGLSDYLRAEYPELPDFETRTSAAIRLPSGVRHIGFEIYFGLRDSYVDIDVYFWREPSFRLWEKLREAPQAWNELIGGVWEFQQLGDKQRGMMSVWRDLPEIRRETHWAEAYRWFGEKLSALYGEVAPRLRDEMDRMS